MSNKQIATTDEHTPDHPYCGDINCPFCHTDLDWHGQITTFDQEVVYQDTELQTAHHILDQQENKGGWSWW